MSIIIVFVMLTLGFLISTKLHNSIITKNEKYFKALKINNDPELFDYAINTNVGNIVSQGKFVANEPVSDSLIDGEYFSIKKIKENYVQKTKTVTYVDSNGTTRTKTEKYWVWEEVDRETFYTNTLQYLGKTFSYKKFSFDNHSYKDTVYTGLMTRYKFYVIPIEFNASVFSVTKSNSIEKNEVYAGYTIDELIEHKEKETDFIIVLFWVIWIVLTAVIVILFVALEIKYLNNYR